MIWIGFYLPANNQHLLRALGGTLEAKRPSVRLDGCLVALDVDGAVLLDELKSSERIESRCVLDVAG